MDENLEFHLKVITHYTHLFLCPRNDFRLILFVHYFTVLVLRNLFGQDSRPTGRY